VSRFDTSTGRQLYDILPEVYRTRDGGETGADLAAWLDACGELLDRIRATLDQRLADSFPDQPPAGRAVQEWLLPYFAQLLDVRLVSPHPEGRREEVARAVGWRQGKGTRSVLDEVAEVVGGSTAEVQEGWKRVAVTPRVDLPLEPVPALAGGLGATPDPNNPLTAARHPGLPAVTPDLRGLLGPAMGCPGGHRDHTRRTPDTRVPSWNAGHFHPFRVLVFVPPPVAFFPVDRIELNWGARHLPEHEHHITDEVGEDGVRSVRNPRPREQTVGILTPPPSFDEGEVVISDLEFDEPLKLKAGPAGGRLVLRGVAAPKVSVEWESGSGTGELVLDARDCLLGAIEAPDAEVRLDASTVLGPTTAWRILASDSLFAGPVEIGDHTGEAPSCIRFSRIPLELARAAAMSLLGKKRINWLNWPATTTDAPIFAGGEICNREGHRQPVAQFGSPGCGTLSPAAPDSIAFGAEDGGEMGAHHRHRHTLRRAAVLKKLEDFLPVGIEAALIPDLGLFPRRSTTETA